MHMSNLLSRSVTTILPTRELLEQKLESNTHLNVYLGIDPTATRIHLGHAVALRKLQRFVEEGHNVTFLIGDFTALIGDTSDKDTERPVLTNEEINENFKTYQEQASKIVDFSKVSVRKNSEWLAALTFADIIKLCQEFSVGDFVSRELVKNRLADGKKVGLHETLYPVMQGYDSLTLDTDVQIGGADQTFNMLAGRTLLKNRKQKESFVLVTGYLEGTDGRKMSKSWGNAIWLTDSPAEMYGKVMSLKDELIASYFEHATNLSEVEVSEKLSRIESGENPMLLKKELAFCIVQELHSGEAAQEASDQFEKTFQHKAPEFDEEVYVAAASTLIDVVSHIVGSISEAKRLLKSHSIEVNGVTVADSKAAIADGDNLQIGKKIFKKVKNQK